VAEVPLIDLSVFGYQRTIAGRAKAAACGTPRHLTDESRLTFGRNACKKLGHCSNSQRHMRTTVTRQLLHTDVLNLLLQLEEEQISKSA
jgi:hypothetical protein